MTDNSKENIKMCEKATEIQEIFKQNLAPGDVVSTNNKLYTLPQRNEFQTNRKWNVDTDGNMVLKKGTSLTITTYKDMSTLEHRPIFGAYGTIEAEIPYVGTSREAIVTITNPTWLPTKSALLDMFEGETTTNSLNIISRIYQWIKENLLYSNKFNASMEQLLLAMLMYNRFNKIWNGTDWEEIT